jgi:hypothetical protein
MKVPLPGDEIVFEAVNGESYVAISSGESLRPNLSLFSVVQELMTADPESSRLSRLSAFPLFLVVIGECFCATAI